MFGNRAKKNSPKNTDQDDGFDEVYVNGDNEEATDNWGTQDDEFNDVTVKPNKSSLLPWAALGLLAAGAGGYYYYTNMMSPPASQQQSQQQDIPQSDLITAQPETQKLNTEVRTEDAIAQQISPPSPLPDDESMTAAPEVTPVMPASEGTETAALPVSSQPTDTLNNSGSPSESPLPTETETTVLSTESLESTAENASTPTVSLSQSTDNSPAPETAPAEHISAQPQMPPPHASDDIAGRLAVLEQQIKDVTHAVDKIAEQKQQLGEMADLRDQVTLLEAQVKALLGTSPRVSGPVAKPQNEASEAASTKTAPVAKPAAAEKAAPAWVLRAAQTGEAWVSKGPQGQLQNVKIGDQLPGIGRITAIAQKDGGWVVVGSKGNIRQ